MKYLVFLITLCAVALGEDQPPATVHFYRYRLGAGQGAHPSVYCDGTVVARMQNGRVFTMQVSAGKHSFISTSKQGGVDLEMEPGKEYFMRLDVIGVWIGHPGLTLTSPEQGRHEIEQLKPLDAKWVKQSTCGK
jgi:hypothetical protein